MTTPIVTGTADLDLVMPDAVRDFVASRVGCEHALLEWSIVFDGEREWFWYRARTVDGVEQSELVAVVVTEEP